MFPFGSHLLQVTISHIQPLVVTMDAECYSRLVKLVYTRRRDLICRQPMALTRFS